MLDNLVESKSNFQNTKRRGGYLVTTAFLVFSMFASGVLWSLFARDLDIGINSVELTSIVTPVPMPEDIPPPPEPIKAVKQENAAKTENDKFVRQDNVARTDEPIAPKEISTSPTTVKSRPNAPFVIGKEDTDPKGIPSTVTRDPADGTKLITSTTTVSRSDAEEPPPAIKKAPILEKQKNTVVSKGVINGSAINLPKPSYPPAAKAVRASGDVNVQVTIDEKGSVIAANAVSGHALLRQVSESAARSARFKPTLLSDVPVKVTGVIVYKFSTQ